MLFRSELMELCNEFYRERYSTERGAFYLQQHLDRSLAALKPVDAVMAEPGPDAMIILSLSFMGFGGVIEGLFK